MPRTGPTQRAAGRQNFVARVHIAKKELALDDDSYRSIIASIAPGKTSAKQLTMKELSELIEAFKSKGWKPKKPARKKGVDVAVSDFRSKRIGLINKVWGDLDEAGALKDPSPASLDTYCAKYMLGDKLQWASSTELNSIVNALKAWLKRVSIES